MQTVVSLLRLQMSATCPYPEPDQSGPYPHAPQFLKIHYNIFVPFRPKSSKLSLYLRSRHQNHACISPDSIRSTCTTHLMLLNLFPRIQIIWEHRSLSSSLCSFLHSPVTSSLLSPNILLNTLFSNTLRLRSSLNVRDQVSHP